jgi:hypothetical protein
MKFIGFDGPGNGDGQILEAAAAADKHRMHALER